jgi:excisionase family DNA binding protein
MLAANTLRKTTNASIVPPSADGTSDQVRSEDAANSVLESHVDVKTAARFLGVSCSLVYSYVERKQIPHYRMMGRTIRFRLSELARWREQFHVAGAANE